MPAKRSDDLLTYLTSSPSPFHACSEAARRLDAAGFHRVEEDEPFDAPDKGVGHYLTRAGSLAAWWSPAPKSTDLSFRILGAHTDSPNLRLKPRPNTGAAGYRQLGVEVYGGALLNSWLDRDLGLSGRVVARARKTRSIHLVKIDRPILRIPQLAIHLDREVNDKGLVLDRQLHLAPIWGLGRPDEMGLQKLLAAELGVAPADLLSWDLMLHDTQPAQRVGVEGEFLSSGRLDNLCSCWCALEALLGVAKKSSAPQSVPVLCLFDHEEVGSGSRSGASSPLLKDLLERIVLAAGGAREDYHRAVARSFCASVDMAHATHPNYRERHEPEHWIAMNAGPVIKVNSNMRYASDAEGEACFQAACESAGVPFQKYSHRSNLSCGTTIGPITAANLGLRTVDVGCAQLAMHSCRELCGARDPELMVQALAAFLRA
jgi:aspartyl aminopeptidase